MSFELDEDTALVAQSPGRYVGTVTGRWMVGAGPNGGYLAAVILRAVLEESALPDPVTMTVHYLARPLVGPCEVNVTTLRVGRGHSSYRAEIVQQDEVRCASLVTTGRLRDPGPADFQPTAPVVPEPGESIAVRRIGESPTLWERLETRAAKGDDLFFLRTEAGEAVTGGWTRLADGRETDALAVALFLDCWPPAVFNRTMQADPIGAPTIEYTVHWRNRPSSQWCYGRFESKTLAGGYVDEHGELWDTSGRLVAESRQLARYLGGRGGPPAAG
ncbi:MAG: thioesterase family protein [Acidimicrobiales bacterium]